MIEFVELPQAREMTGVRLVVVGAVPSPWSEAAKGLFLLAKVPVVAVRASRANPEIKAWTGIENAPAVLHDKEPVYSSWAAIVGLAARLAGDQIVPSEPEARAEAMGLLEMIAGDGGIGWNGRLVMIHHGLTGSGGFEPKLAGYLAKRYGYSEQAIATVRERSGAQLDYLARRLGTREYFGGDRPNAVDIYTATFLTPLRPISEADCPAMAPALRSTFATAAEELGPLVPPSLFALRTRMFERHLPWPIAL